MSREEELGDGERKKGWGRCWGETGVYVGGGTAVRGKEGGKAQVPCLVAVLSHANHEESAGTLEKVRGV